MNGPTEVGKWRGRHEQHVRLEFEWTGALFPLKIRSHRLLWMKWAIVSESENSINAY